MQPYITIQVESAEQLARDMNAAHAAGYLYLASTVTYATGIVIMARGDSE